MPVPSGLSCVCTQSVTAFTSQTYHSIAYHSCVPMLSSCTSSCTCLAALVESSPPSLSAGSASASTATDVHWQPTHSSTVGLSHNIHVTFWTQARAALC